MEVEKDGGPLPQALHASRTRRIPKSEHIADPDDVRPIAGTPCPLTMITIGDKFIALRINYALAPVVARTVSLPPPRLRRQPPHC